MSVQSSRSVFERSGQEDDTSDISTRVRQITISAIKQMPVLAAKLGGCVSLGQGIPSLNTPDFIREAIIKDLRENNAIGKYSIQPGVPELKQEIAKDLQRTRGMTVDPEKDIFVSCGGMEALAAGIATIVDRGDEVILPSPTYASHIEQVLFAEGIPRFVPLFEEESGWKLDIEGIRKAITKKTKAIILCNPVNPTGAVFSEAEMKEIARIVLEHDIFLVMDEAYDFLVYDNRPYYSLMSMPELKDNIIAVCSFSKRYCMTGWRVGFMYSSERIIRQVLKVHDAFAICAPTISQYAALAALRATNGKDGPGDRSVQELVTALDNRRNLVCRRLDGLSNFFSYVKPEGGYYVFPRLKQTAGATTDGADAPPSSIDFTLRMLNEARVITIPGSAFGPTGEGHIRISFGAAEEELTEAFDRMEKYLTKN